MTLTAFVFFMLGALLEILWLWDEAHARGQAPLRLGFLRFSFGRVQWLQGGLVVMALALAGLLALFGLGGVWVSLSDAWVGFIFVALGLFILGAGVVANGLLPRVSEQSILIVQLLVIVTLLLTIDQPPPAVVWLLGLGLPAVVMLYLVLNPNPVEPLLKAVVYLCYLCALLARAFQNGAADFFISPDLGPLDALVFGATFVFLLLHGLFAVRFFLIVSSLLVPRNRPLVRRMMPRLFADDQVPPWRFVFFALVVIALVALNAWLKLVSMAVLLNLAVLVSVQFFFKPGRLAGERD